MDKGSQENLFRFREFPVYKDARKFRRDLKAFLKEKLPKEEMFGLRSQTWRALDSILLNIAEGSGRLSDKDFSHFLNNAVTSAYEVMSCLDCVVDDGFATIDEIEPFIKRLESIVKQLRAFTAKVRNDNRKR